jgi:hypothetical protein
MGAFQSEIHHLKGEHSMHTEFMQVAGRIAEGAANGGIAIGEIGEMVSQHQGEVNCYPGIASAQCHPISFFVALHGRLAKGKGHYNFAQILEEFVRHMQGRCPGITRHAILITDAWWHDHYEKWYANIEAIKREGVAVEAYWIGIGGRVSQLSI